MGLLTNTHIIIIPICYQTPIRLKYHDNITIAGPNLCFVKFQTMLSLKITGETQSAYIALYITTAGLEVGFTVHCYRSLTSTQNIIRTEHYSVGTLYRTEHYSVGTLYRTEHYSVGTLYRTEHYSVGTLYRTEHYSVRTLYRTKHYGHYIGQSITQ